MSYEKQKNILLQAVEKDLISHAYLFEGADLVGVAQWFAGQISSGVDIKLVTNALFDPKKETAAISVDTVRGMIADVYLRPYHGGRKVYIVPDADTLTVQAQNSMLKVLEEPPEYCVIILLAGKSDAFLPTVLSRVTVLAFPSEGAGYSREEMELRDEVFRYAQGLTEPKRMEMYRFVEFIKKNRKSADLILRELIGFLREAGHIMAAETVIKTIRQLDGNVNFNAAVQVMAVELWEHINN